MCPQGFKIVRIPVLRLQFVRKYSILKGEIFSRSPASLRFCHGVFFRGKIKIEMKRGVLWYDRVLEIKSNVKGDSMRNSRRYGYGSRKERSKPPVLLLCIILLVVFAGCFALYMRQAEAKNPSAISTLPLSPGIFTTTESAAPPTESAVSSEKSASPEDSVSSSEVETMGRGSAVNPVPEGEKQAMSWFDDAVFVGDSLSVGLSAYGILPEANVLAQQGMNIDKINNATIKTVAGETTILNAIQNAAPSKVFIMLGSNGIAWLSNETMIQEYSQFILDVRDIVPNATIYVLSIPPVSTVAEQAATPILNTSIDVYNSELLKMTNNLNVRFVDVNTALKGNDGKMPEDRVSSRDGMHFNRSTYTIMLDYILSHTGQPVAAPTANASVSSGNSGTDDSSQAPADSDDSEDLSVIDLSETEESLQADAVP